MSGFLLLEDGACFEGVSEGVPGECCGDVVLNTAVVGYQEIMTDPANAGKIVILTYPLIGNYGVASRFDESGRVWLHGLGFKERSRVRSNWASEGSFDSFLRTRNVIALSGIDTRTLAVRIRDHGEMFGLVSTEGTEPRDAQTRLAQAKTTAETNFIRAASAKAPKRIADRPGGPNLAVLDLGMLRSFTDQLLSLGCAVSLLPYDTPAAEVLDQGFDALVISGGPEDDAGIPQVVEEVKLLIGRLPILGISLGHQILALALGGRLSRMHVGHHGVNYPVRAPESFKGDITVQNHSFTVEEDTLPRADGLRVTLRNVNDDTVEEMESPELRVLSAQYYPVRPCSAEPNPLFLRFLSLIAGTTRN